MWLASGMAHSNEPKSPTISKKKKNNAVHLGKHYSDHAYYFLTNELMISKD